MTALIELKDVAKTYELETGGTVRVLQGLNISINEGEFVAFLGPSGSGKSTCLRIMGGLTPKTSGDVLCRGSALQGINKDVAMVFQSFALFPWETVQENIAMALDRLGLSPLQVKDRVRRVIDIVGLEGFEEAYPRELSGGMKQRVGIARALVMQRPILFLDEPFSALDVLTADTLRDEVVKIFRDGKTATKAVVLVTHNIQEAVSMAQRVLVMGTSPGRIRAEVAIDLPYPRDDQSMLFRKKVSEIHALITEAIMPDVPPAAQRLGESAPPSARREPPVESLPKAQIAEVIGLLEAIFDKGGQADIFELSHQTRRDFGTTLYLIKAAELLELVDTPKQSVVLTDLGKYFVQGDINVRKRMLHELFGCLRVVQLVTSLLRSNENLRIRVDELSARISEWLPNENPHDILETLISWGRFAEYFGYSDDAKEVYLDVGQEVV